MVVTKSLELTVILLMKLMNDKRTDQTKWLYGNGILKFSHLTEKVKWGSNSQWKTTQCGLKETWNVEDHCWIVCKLLNIKM